MRGRVRKVAGKASNGPEVLRIRCGNVKGADAAIGLSMKLIVDDLVVGENLLQEGKMRSPPSKQLAIRRRGNHDNVAAPLGLDNARCAGPRRRRCS